MWSLCELKLYAENPQKSNVLQKHYNSSFRKGQCEKLRGDSLNLMTMLLLSSHLKHYFS